MSTPLPREGEPGYRGPRTSERRRRQTGPGTVGIGVGALGALAVGNGELVLSPALLAPLLLLPVAAGWYGSKKLPPRSSRGVRATTGASLGAGAVFSVMFGYLLATVFGLAGDASAVDALRSVGTSPVVTVVVALVAGAAAGAAGAQLVAPRDPDAPPGAW